MQWVSGREGMGLSLGDLLHGEALVWTSKKSTSQLLVQLVFESPINCVNPRQRLSAHQPPLLLSSTTLPSKIFCSCDQRLSPNSRISLFNLAAPLTNKEIEHSRAPPCVSQYKTRSSKLRTTYAAHREVRNLKPYFPSPLDLRRFLS